MTAVLWFSDGIGWLLLALVIAVVAFGGTAVLAHRRDVRELHDNGADQ